MITSRSFSVLLVSLSLLAVAACSPTRTQKSAGEQIDDTVVTAKVKAALVDNPVTKARQIDVEVFRGSVQLNGFVATAAEKSQATATTRSVQGVRNVHNNLLVRAPDATAGQVVDDAVLTGKVKTALVGSPITKAHQINVETRGGVVQLSGFVDSAAAKAEAGRLAREVTGVRSVRNEIDVKT